jgi:hypothetical protein
VRSSSGRESVLTSSPGGYLFAAGVTPGVAPPALCASNIQHGAASGRGATERAIEGVDIECAVLKDGAWTRLATVVDADHTWASCPGTGGCPSGALRCGELARAVRAR